MSIPLNTSKEALASMAEYLNPETGLSKCRQISTGNVFEVHAVDFKSVDGWEFMHRNTPSVTERLEALSQAQLVALRQQNGTLTGASLAHPADLIREITELVRLEQITMPESN